MENTDTQNLAQEYDEEAHPAERDREEGLADAEDEGSQQPGHEQQEN